MKNFDFNTVKDFDNHISSSILGYDLLYSLVKNLIEFYIKDGVVYDLGCTSGKLISEIKEEHKVDCVGYDITDKNFIYDNIKLIKADIVKDKIDLSNADVIMSIFTLQFIRFDDRIKVLKKVYDNLSDTGCFILCEKERSVFDHKFEFANYQNKRNNFSDKEILDKERALRKVMHPVTTVQNRNLLNNAGFEHEIFFKSLNFTGYICTK